MFSRLPATRILRATVGNNVISKSALRQLCITDRSYHYLPPVGRGKALEGGSVSSINRLGSVFQRAIRAHAMARISYKPARRGDDADVLHSVRVEDPYRWLEDPDSDETQQWVRQQVETTGGYFAGLKDARDKIRARLEELQSYERVGCPFTRGEHSFVFRNTGLQNQDVLFKLPKSIVASATPHDSLFESGNAHPFLDLNVLFPDGTTALGSSSLSEDGSLYAYGLSKGGSDWQTLHVRDVATGQDLPDTVPWTKFTRIAWLHDGSGFFYSRHPAPPEVASSGSGAGSDKAGTETSSTQYCMVFFHEIGTPASADLLIHAVPSQPVWRFGAEVSDDGEYLIITTFKGTDPVCRLYFAHLPSIWSGWKAAARKAQEDAKSAVASDGDVNVPSYLRPGGVPPPSDAYAYLPLVPAIDSFAAEFDYITNDGPRFYLKTNAAAPRYRVVAVDFPPSAPHSVHPPDHKADVDQPLPALYDTVEHHAKDVLDWAAVVGGRYLLTCYLRDVANALVIRLLPSSPPPLTSGATTITASSEVPLPGPGTIVSFSGRRDQDTAYVKHVSLLSPGTLLRLQFNTPANDPSGHPEALNAGMTSDGAVAAPNTQVSALEEAGVRIGASTSSSAGFTARVPHPYGASFTLTGASPVSAAGVSTLYETRLRGFDASQYEASRVFVPSKDGAVQLPVFLVKKRRRDRPAPAPTLLYGEGRCAQRVVSQYPARHQYACVSGCCLLQSVPLRLLSPICHACAGYGGFNVSLQPSFSALRLLWLNELGGTYALACVRGGGASG